jgi:hypothetical protein
MGNRCPERVKMKMRSLSKPQYAVILMVGWLWVLVGCSNDTSYRYPDKTELETQSYHGFEIPIFPTAEGQLNYARSGFPNPDEKRAALDFVAQQFPENSAQCGAAALNLVYMNLEPDYRFALHLDYQNAIAGYKKVINSFADQPRVLAKAHWYIGWIYCDLLGQPEKGLPYYRHIVAHYPDLEMGISSPVPWVSLVYSSPVNGTHPQKATVKKHWAGLSLLEIIRHTVDAREKKRAFGTLWKKYRHSVATGFAIRMLLRQQNEAQLVKPYAAPYLALGVANPYLSREIAAAAEELWP